MTASLRTFAECAHTGDHIATKQRTLMTLVAEHPNPFAVLDAVIADMRASGDTGHVENLLQARADFAELIEAAHEMADFQFAELLHQSDKVDVPLKEFCRRKRLIRAALVRIGGTP